MFIKCKLEDGTTAIINCDHIIVITSNPNNDILNISLMEYDMPIFVQKDSIEHYNINTLCNALC